jgi:superkiller protein 3
MLLNSRRWHSLPGRAFCLAAIAVAAAGADDESCYFGPPSAAAPNSSAARHYYSARSLVSQHKPVEATAEFRRALAADPKHAAAHFGLAELLAGQGKPVLTEALIHLFETVRLCPDSREARVRLAEVLAQSGDIEASIAQLEEACRRWPDDAAVHDLLGNAQLRLKQHARALESYVRALQLDPQRLAARYGRAMALLGLGLEKEAAVEFTAIVTADPAHALAHFQLGKIARESGALAQAEAHLRTAVANAPDLPGPHIELAHLYRQQNKSKEAEAEFRAALGLNPRLESAVYALAQLVQATGDKEEAARLFSEFSKLREGRTAATSITQADSLNATGLDLMNSGMLDKALESFRRALELEPTFATAAYNIGAVLAKQGKTQEAIQAFRKAIELRPASPMPHYALSILLKMTAHPDAGEELRRAHLLNELTPKAPAATHTVPAAGAACANDSAKHPIERLIDAGRLEEARRQLSSEPAVLAGDLRTYLEAHILFKERRFPESIQLLEGLFRLEGARSPAPEVFTLMGLNHVQMDELRLAEPFLETAAEKCPESYLARFHLALLYYTTNRFSDAERQLRHVVRLNPDFAKAYEILGLAIEELGKPEAAIEAYRESIGQVERQGLKDGSPYLSLGKFLLARGRTDEAVGLLETAVKLAPGSAEAAYSLGKALHQLKQFRQAEESLLKSVQLDPEYVPPHYLLGRLYLSQERTTEAGKQMEIFRQLEAASRAGRRDSPLKASGSWYVHRPTSSR